MTETRKQIIELIEPYMDKTLNFGCYIEYDGTVHNDFRTGFGKEILQLIQPNSYTYSNEILALWNNEEEQVMYRDKHNFKILGDYEVTALEKYILLSENYNYGIDHRSYIDYRIYYDKSGKGPDIRIKNKPLHLYTEQEEKSLLELLKKLGNNT